MDTLRHMGMAMDSVLQCLNRYTTSHLIFNLCNLERCPSL